MAYVDQTQPIGDGSSADGWAGNAGYQAYADQTDPYAVRLVPIVGIPLFSSNPNEDSNHDNQYKAFASGQHDAVIRGIVDQWTTDRVAGSSKGYKTIYFRLAWEFNQPGGNWYVGDDSASQADWPLAFAHVATVIRSEAAKNGAVAYIVYNLSMNNNEYSIPNVITAEYPGDAYVDVVGIDMYADMYPRGDNDAGNPYAAQGGYYYDWDLNNIQNPANEDPSPAVFVNDPLNRQHYWNYPSGKEYTPQGDSTIQVSFDEVLAFARQHSKAFAVPETGAGNSGDCHDIADDPTLPMWLGAKLFAAQAAGVPIAFVSPWDSNGDGPFEFSFGSDNKPLEKASFAKCFGNIATAATCSNQTIPATPIYANVVVGTGPNLITLQVSENERQLQDASFIVQVDGQQLGSSSNPHYCVGAAQKLNQTERFDFKGTWPSGSHSITITSLNGASLYVTKTFVDGTVQSPGKLTFTSPGSQTETVNN